MNIAFFETDNYEKEYLEKSLNSHNLSFHSHPLDNTDIRSLKKTQVLGVFIYSHLNRLILKELLNLKLIVTMSTGYDHIDLEYCKRRNIAVCNVPKYGSASVAEHTFALILALVRNLDDAIENTRHDDFSLDNLKGIELAGKTLGIIGYGTIGRHVAEIARAFGMQVLVTENKIQDLNNQTKIIFVSLKYVLKKSDIITLHTPLTEKTHHLINAKTLKLIKKGSFLINTARGPIIDTPAVAQAISSKRLAGFAADVLEGECELKEAHQPLKSAHSQSHNWSLLRKNHSLLKQKNVIITPHMAFYTKESLDIILKTTTQNIKAFEKGKSINLIL